MALSREIGVAKAKCDRISRDLIEEDTRARQERRNVIDTQRMRLKAAADYETEARRRVAEAMARRKEAIDRSLKDDFVADLEAVSALESGNATIWTIGHVLWLVFVAIETMPVLVKLTTRRGTYDVLLDQIEAAASARGVQL
jgi:hypothetical protein